MELCLKSKVIKRKSKKRKINLPVNAIVPLIKPDACDGISNWMLMQKIIEPSKKQKLEKESVKKMLKLGDFCPNLVSYKPTYSHKKKSSQSSPGRFEHSKVGNDPSNDGDKYSKEKSQLTSEIEASKKNGNNSYKFNFNGGNSNDPPQNDSDNETKRGEKYGEKRLTKAIAMDCEMVGTGPKGEESIIARVSIVNVYGVCVYDEFVKPREKVTDFRTKISGVRPSDLKKGKELFEVQKDVSSIIEGRILVGHSIKHDLDVLFMSHPRHLIRDTAFYKPFRDICGGRTPSLKKLTARILGCDIQSGEHSSIEDAQAAMLLYLRQKQEWEKEVRSQRRRKPKIITNSAYDMKN